MPTSPSKIGLRTCIILTIYQRGEAPPPLPPTHIYTPKQGNFKLWELYRAKDFQRKGSAMMRGV